MKRKTAVTYLVRLGLPPNGDEGLSFQRQDHANGGESKHQEKGLSGQCTSAAHGLEQYTDAVPAQLMLLLL